MNNLSEFEAFHDFIALLNDFNNFSNSPLLESFLTNATKDELKTWDNIILVTQVIKAKINHDTFTLSLEEIHQYNHYAGNFYNLLLEKYMGSQSQIVLNQFMLNNTH